MVKFLVDRIIKGYLKFDNVPPSLKEMVKEELLRLECADLIPE